MARRERRIDREAEFESLGVNITDVNTTFVSKENIVALSCGVNADIVLGIGRVGEEGFDDEVAECASHGFDLRKVSELHESEDGWDGKHDMMAQI